MNTPRIPSILQILRNDYLAITLAFTPLILWLLPLVVYGLPAALGTRTPALNPLALPGMAAITVFCWAALVWRVTMVRTIFANGDLVEGIITRIWFYRQRGQCELSFTHMGMVCTAKSTLVKTEKARRLAVGGKVMLVVDAGDVKRVFLRDLYF
jgi:hypothetical protein